MDVENNRIAKLLKDALQHPGMFTPSNNKDCVELFNACLELFERDNVCTTISNQDGVICGSYPFKLIVPLKQLGSMDESNGLDDGYSDASAIASKEFMELTSKGRLARTRGRFPIPSLLVGNKYVCRSSTLARSAEMYAQQYAQQGYQYLMKGSSSATAENDQSQQKSETLLNEQLSGDQMVHYSQNNSVSVNLKKNSKSPTKFIRNFSKPINDDDQNNEWLLDKMRKKDIDILRRLKVNVICDLMVENKKVKFGVNVTSSEKVDRLNRYSAFDLVGIPYPGCEFFAEYSDNNYVCHGLKFNWNQAFIDAEFQVPDYVSDISGVDWKNYMEWDIVLLTQNYLKLILKCLLSPQSSGILLHCISGWDRTPLFITFVRLSLWADGLIHQSLTAEEIVYLTLTYDWLLFRHQFYDRIYKNEEIMHFCFEFLQYMVSEDFSVLPAIRSVEHPFVHFHNKDAFSLNDSNNSNGFTYETNAAPAVKYSQTDLVTKKVSEIEVGESLSEIEVVQECLESVLSTVAQNKEVSKQTEETSRWRKSSCSCSSNSACTQEEASYGDDFLANQQTFAQSCDSSKGVGARVFDPKLLFQESIPGADSETADLVSLPSEHNSSINGANSFASSISLPVNCGESSLSDADDDSMLRLKLEKRREKLMMARNILLPAYCSVVPKQKELMQSGISGLMGSLGTTLANFVKRA